MEPIWNEPALVFRLTMKGREETFLAASELHIGYEGELARRGAYLLSRTRTLAARLNALGRASRASRLVLLGDVKHRIAHVSPQEARDVPAFFEALDAFDHVDVALGNHDVGLRDLVPTTRFPRVKIHPASGFLLRGDKERVACLHGHAWPRPGLLSADVVLVGHTHAAVALVDEQGQARTEWVWLRGRLDAAAVKKRFGRSSRARVIVFPPFNPLLGGAAVNRDGLLGPFDTLLDRGDVSLHLLDGRALGHIDIPSPKSKKKNRPMEAT